jgi:hypothetical protein
MAVTPTRAVPATIAPLSPHLETAIPAGISKTSWPMPFIATTKLAAATVEPSSRANSGITGITAPWPMENRIVGR